MTDLAQASAMLSEAMTEEVNAEQALQRAVHKKSEALKEIAVAIAPRKRINLVVEGEKREYTICVREKTGLYYLKGKGVDTPAVDL